MLEQEPKTPMRFCAEVGVKAALRVGMAVLTNLSSLSFHILSSFLSEAISLFSFPSVRLPTVIETNDLTSDFLTPATNKEAPQALAQWGLPCLKQ